MATLSEDGNRLFVILAGGSWTRTVPCRMEFRGFLPRQAMGEAFGAMAAWGMSWDCAVELIFLDVLAAPS